MTQQRLSGFTSKRKENARLYKVSSSNVHSRFVHNQKLGTIQTPPAVGGTGQRVHVTGRSSTQRELVAPAVTRVVKRFLRDHSSVYTKLRTATIVTKGKSVPVTGGGRGERCRLAVLGRGPVCRSPCVTRPPGPEPELPASTSPRLLLDRGRRHGHTANTLVTTGRLTLVGSTACK